ncbi:MAG: hypothetical protein M5U19_15855 [Microthrixaceae bacterium]|nr:hypothetical protein [Microthrixaceae bacterium]
MILTALCGHGMLDMAAYDAYFAGELVDHEYPEEGHSGRHGEGAPDLNRPNGPDSRSGPYNRVVDTVTATGPTESAPPEPGEPGAPHRHHAAGSGGSC